MVVFVEQHRLPAIRRERPGFGNARGDAVGRVEAVAVQEDEVGRLDDRFRRRRRPRPGDNIRPAPRLAGSARWPRGRGRDSRAAPRSVRRRCVRGPFSGVGTGPQLPGQGVQVVECAVGHAAVERQPLDAQSAPNPPGMDGTPVDGPVAAGGPDGGRDPPRGRRPRGDAGPPEAGSAEAPSRRASGARRRSRFMGRTIGRAPPRGGGARRRSPGLPLRPRKC